MGLKNLRERYNDPYMAEVFQGMFPTDNPRNTRFAINFFTAIGLGGLTDGLRLHLKNAPKMIMEAQARRGYMCLIARVCCRAALALVSFVLSVQMYLCL